MKIHWKITMVLWKITIFVKRFYRYQKPYFLATVVFSAIISLFMFCMLKEKTNRSVYTSDEIIEFHLKQLVLQEKGSGCNIPELDPFSKQASLFDTDVPKNMNCEGIKKDWVKCYLSECSVTKEILSELEDVVCLYRDINFLTDDQNSLGLVTRLYGDSKYILNASDHVKVTCWGENKSGVKPITSRWFGYVAGYRPLKKKVTPKEDACNVLILMFDSFSRNNFIRKLPKSYEFLKKEMQAVVLKSYNIIGNGALKALFPILTGHTDLELLDSRRIGWNRMHVDQDVLIFGALRKRGYRTAYFENDLKHGSFQHRYNGFDRPPADHYLRPFYVEEARKVKNLWDNHKKKFCVGDVARHCFLLNYTSQFLKLPGKKFGLMFNRDSHGHHNSISMIDDDLTQFLKDFKDSGGLNDTALFVMANYGYRYGPFRTTHMGRIEERLPFLSITLPERLKSSRPEALKNLLANSEVLTTPFDIHTTFLDILGMKDTRNKDIVPGADIVRGWSLFDKIPNTRSCPEAGIRPFWCSCVNWLDVSMADHMYKMAASVLADFISDLTDDKRYLCAKRKLKSIEWVRRMASNYKDKAIRDRFVRPISEHYMVKITLTPENAVYEGALQYIVKDKYFMIAEGDISRVNSYGDEPSCLNDMYPYLNKYCYCNNKLKNNMTESPLILVNNILITT